MLKSGCITIVFVGLLLGCVDQANAAQLVFFDENGGGGNPRGLYNFDTLTGISTLRAPVTGNERFFAIDIRPSDGTAFAISFGPVPALYTIDLFTGEFSLVGPTGIGNPHQLVGLAFQPGTGNLYGLANQGGLYSISQITGAATFIGNTGRGTNAVECGLVFAPWGQLYGFADYGPLYTIDPATGATNWVGYGNPLPPSPGLTSEDAAFDNYTDLYQIDYGGRIYLTDPFTGQGRIIGNTGLGNGALALVVAPPVPEPSTLVLIALGLGVTALLRRRQ